VPADEHKAIIALVLAIASFVVCPLIPAIVALVSPPRATQEIRRLRRFVSGDGDRQAAKIVSWVNIAGCAPCRGRAVV
jgi:hypothetical protein